MNGPPHLIAKDRDGILTVTFSHLAGIGAQANR